MTVRILNGDCRDVLKSLPDESVHCVVTSPPYWGLRDYGIPNQIGLEQTPAAFVGDLVAVFQEVRRVLRDDGTLWLVLDDSYATDAKGERGIDKSTLSGGEWQMRAHPPKLARGNWRGEGYKRKDLIGIPWRVALALQEDGWWLRCDVIWAKTSCMPENVQDRPTRSHEYVFLLSKSQHYHYDADAVREPDVGADHPRNVIAQPEPSGGVLKPHTGIRRAEGRNGQGRNRRSVWTVGPQPYIGGHTASFPPALIEPCILAGCPEFTCAACGTAIDSIHENVRSRTNGQALENMQVVRRQGDAGPPQSSEELLQQGMCFSLDSEASLDHQRIHDNEQGIQGAAHAEASACVEPRLRVGTSSGDGTNAGTAADEERNCSSQERHQDRQSTRELGVDGEVGARQITQTEAQADQVSALSRVDRYGRSHCSKCKADLTASGAIKPGVVLDCFGGAGTTGLVADRMGRDAVLIELNPEYAAMAKRRIQGDSPLFAEVS